MACKDAVKMTFNEGQMLPNASNWHQNLKMPHMSRDSRLHDVNFISKEKDIK